jgi:hypothetical protein
MAFVYPLQEQKCANLNIGKLPLGLQRGAGIPRFPSGTSIFILFSILSNYRKGTVFVYLNFVVILHFEKNVPGML